MYRYYDYYIKKFKLEFYLDNIWLNGYVQELWDYMAGLHLDFMTELDLDEKLDLEYDKTDFFRRIDWKNKLTIYLRNHVENRLVGNLVNFIKKSI